MTNGQPKFSTCLKALQQMEVHGVIWLPLPTQESRRGTHEVTWTAASEPGEPITGSRGDFPDLQWQLVEPGSASASLWSELVRRYHPLHSAHMAGPQLRYLAVVHDRVVACLGFGAPALKLAARDQWIGWTPEERTAHLSQVVENRRFLVLPWVHVQGLASSFSTDVFSRDGNDRNPWIPLKRWVRRPRILSLFTGPTLHFANLCSINLPSRRATPIAVV